MVETSRLRHALIGVGSLVFNMHKSAFSLPTFQAAGACDIREEVGRERAAGLDVPFYVDYREMLAEVKPDVTVIMTPHYLHPQMAIDAMRTGSHVLVEKPMGIQISDADRMVQVQHETGRCMAVSFQNRLRPEVRAARKLIQDGRLGTIQRLEMIVPWPRSYRYYSLATWRATWWGEGGGVLLNQAPHDLDLICHLAGMPSRVISWNRTRLHQIEVEDSVSAMMEWDNGASGYLRVSTAESGPKKDLEIVGTKGTIKISAGKLDFWEFEDDVYHYLRTTDEIYRGPDQKAVPLEIHENPADHITGDHPAVYHNLHQAILSGSPISATGEEGRMSLELANAMIYSSFTGQVTELPLDREKYSALLRDLQEKPAKK